MNKKTTLRFFIMDISLHLTSGVRELLWRSYNPRADCSSSGLLLAGRGSDQKWYVSSAVVSATAFDIIGMESEENRLLRGYFSRNQQTRKVIPWLEYRNKDYDADFAAFIDAYLRPPFSDLVVLKPTPQEGKRHFVMNHLSTATGLATPRRLNPIPPQDLDREAEQNVSHLMDYWILVDRFHRKGLRIVCD